MPQGTLLGPKCFLVYINDLETPAPLYKYVDDSTLFEICHRTSESVLQHSVDIAARWTLHNDMKINSDKSKEMLISFMQDPDLRSTVPRLIIDGNEIDDVKYAKLLGVTISSDLTWNKHVESIETVQKRALKCIYPGNEYADILCLTNLPCLKERRDSLCKKYFQNIMETTHRLNYLLPCQRCNHYDV